MNDYEPGKAGKRILEIVRELAQEEARSRGTYVGWEGLATLADVIARVEFSELLPIAILRYLDEAASLSPQSHE